MPNNFSIGDKVIIKRRNKRTPSYLLTSLRLDHHRTIVAIFYDDKAQHTRYYLGTNNRGDIDLSSVHFRSIQLSLWSKRRIGRPKTKRRYNSPYSKPQGVVAVIGK